LNDKVQPFGIESCMEMNFPLWFTFSFDALLIPAFSASNWKDDRRHYEVDLLSGHRSADSMSQGPSKYFFLQNLEIPLAIFVSAVTKIVRGGVLSFWGVCLPRFFKFEWKIGPLVTFALVLKKPEIVNYLTQKVLVLCSLGIAECGKHFWLQGGQSMAMRGSQRWPSGWTDSRHQPHQCNTRMIS
jgi:hypothetical protein